MEGSVETDRELLNRLAHTCDEGAFGLLVKRHGAMVLKTCMNILVHRQDAEDAAQTIFPAWRSTPSGPTRSRNRLSAR